MSTRSWAGRAGGLHPIQQAFVESGAIQCGYCTPAQVLAAKELLERNPDPSEEAVREALSGVLCRCTGYLKPVQAVLAPRLCSAVKLCSRSMVLPLRSRRRWNGCRPAREISPLGRPCRI